MPLTPFPKLWIQIEDTIIKFGHIINNSMEGEIMFHLSDPCSEIRSIKCFYFKSGKARVMRNGIRMKGHIKVRVLTFIVGMFLKGGRSKGLFQPLGDRGKLTLSLCQFTCNFGLKGVQM
jgi:hypothetical protein